MRNSGFQIERILCPVDFSGLSASAFWYACSLARQFRAKVFLFHAVELFRYASASFSASASLYDEFCRNLLEEARGRMRTFAGSRSHSEIEIEELLCCGIAADEILSFARSHTASLIVLGTHGRREFDRLLLGSVAENLLKRAECPVMLVRQPASNGGDGGAVLRRILCCTDFAGNSGQIMSAALSLAQGYGAELTLLHVIEAIHGSAELATVAATAMERLEELISAEAGKSATTRTAVRAGRAYREIVQFSSEMGADLGIVGVHGRDALSPVVFGSTAYRIIHLASCPVLAVRT